MIVVSDPQRFVPRGTTGLVTQDGKAVRTDHVCVASRAFKGATELEKVCVGDAVAFTSQKTRRASFLMILE